MGCSSSTDKTSFNDTNSRDTNLPQNTSGNNFIPSTTFTIKLSGISVTVAGYATILSCGN